MQSIVEKLYGHFGDDHPCRRTYPPHSPYYESAQLRQSNLDKLMEQLNDSEKEILEKYCDMQDELNYATHYDTFACGLKIGLLLMGEAYHESL